MSPPWATEQKPCAVVSACVLMRLVQQGYEIREGFTGSYEVLVQMNATGAKVRSAPGPHITNTSKVTVIDVKNSNLLWQLSLSNVGFSFFSLFFFLQSDKHYKSSTAQLYCHSF